VPYNFVADSFHTNKLCSRLSSLKYGNDFTRKNRRFAFLSPSLVGLGATYDDHLRLIGKHIVDFLLVLIELFLRGVMAEALRANLGSKSAIVLQWGPVDPKISCSAVIARLYKPNSCNYASTAVAIHLAIVWSSVTRCRSVFLGAEVSVSYFGSHANVFGQTSAELSWVQSVLGPKCLDNKYTRVVSYNQHPFCLSKSRLHDCTCIVQGV